MRVVNNRKSQNIFDMFSVTTILLALNVLVFILQQIFGDFFSKLTLTSGTFLTKPWTILTSMFMHGSLTHLLFNMYALVIFGKLIEQIIGKKRFVLAYFASGITAAAAFEVYHVALGQLGINALGASGAIMGILGLTIMLLPKMKVLFFFIVPMSMRTAGIIFAAIDIFGMFNPSSGIAHIAHLGGLAVGLLYGYYLMKQSKLFKQKFANKTRVFTQTTSNTVRQNNPSSSYNKTIEMTQDDIDNYFKYGKL